MNELIAVVCSGGFILAVGIIIVLYSLRYKSHLNNRRDRDVEQLNNINRVL